MSMLSNLELIRRVPLFALLTSTQAEAVADAVIKRRFKRAVNHRGAGREVQHALHHPDRTRPRGDRRTSAVAK
jgi:hypothetical protein